MTAAEPSPELHPLGRVITGAGRCQAAIALAGEGLAFRLAWAVGKARLRLRQREHALPPAGPGAAIYLTTVVRLPPEVTHAIGSALDRLRTVDPGHHYYPPETIHLTVSNLDGLFAENRDPAGRLAELEAAIGSHPSFEVRVSGLSVWRRTTFAQVFPPPGMLVSLRSELDALVERASGRRRKLSPAGFFRDLAYANVVRFSGRVSPAFLYELAQFRGMEFGRARVTEIELCRTDRLLSPEGTTVLARFPLSGRPTP